MTPDRAAGTEAAGAAERVALALQAGRVGTWHWDLATGVVDRDHTMDQLLGLEPGSVVPGFEEYLARVHPDDLPDMHRALQQALASRTPTFANEHRILRADGVLRWMRCQTHLSFGPDGSPSEIVGVVMDVTEQRRSEDARTAAVEAKDVALRRAAAVERRVALLARAADLLDAPLDVGAALQEVATLAVEELADWCVVDLTAGSRMQHAAVAHRDPSLVARARDLRNRYPRNPDDAIFAQVVGRLEPLLVEQLDDALLERLSPDEEYLRAVREFHISSFLIVPLVAGGKGIGAISLVSCHGRRLGAQDLELAVDLGRRAGAAVEKTRLYAELRETSQVLQSSLLPATLPDIPGVTLSAHYRSGTEGLQIGGDFYDVFRTGRDRWWVALGDVCGKGPAAAALTAGVRYALRAVAPDSTDPSQVLRRLNEVLLDQAGEGRFTSVVLATFVCAPSIAPSPPPPTELSLSVASAGHPPPLLFCPQAGAATPLGCAGTVAGLFPQIEVESIPVTLRAGQSLLFYTDGATEARALDGDLVGETGLARLLAEHHGGPAAGRSRRVADALLTRTGGTLRDDLALLALDIGAPG